LARILDGLPTAQDDPNVLVGLERPDDAGVVRIAGDRAIVLTVDIITPLVDDPRAFGSIAAANSISDLYAMGARPIAALNIACFVPSLPAEVYRAILSGAAETARAAGCPIVGGHTIKDTEIKFGLAAVGEVHPQRILTKGGALPGDALVLTKPLGTSALATALKRGVLSEGESAYERLIASMTTLNADAADVALRYGAHALTDITGFGLSGHSLEMAQASGVTLEIQLGELPVLPRALELLAAGHTCGGTAANRARAQASLEICGAPGEALLALLHDPQTSGPLLMALPPAAADAAVAELRRRGHADTRRIGRALPQATAALRVVA
jgi:selenide,water dikinase